jgi:hypothetical protein
MPEADAIKAKGTHNQKFGSATKNIVCGDKLCSDVKRDGKANQQSRFQVGGVLQQSVDVDTVTSDASNEASATTYADTDSFTLSSSGAATLKKAVTKGTNPFDKGTHTISVEITADIDSVDAKGIPKLSHIAGTFTIDGANNSQDVTDQAFTKLKLTIPKDLKSIKWTAKEGSGQFNFATKLDFDTKTDKDGKKSKISKIAIGKATFTPKVSTSSIDFN